MSADPATPDRRSRTPGPAGRLLLGAVGFYRRAISPALPPRCRFYPSCSAYAVEALEIHGAARGGWLALRRLGKCAPWHPGGVDLVPPARSAAPGTDRAHPPASRRAAQQEAGVA